MTVSLCAIAKCENLYIKEWADYHFNLGFDHIYIFDNNETDGERISDVLNDERITIIDYRGRHQASCETQVKAYNECYPMCKDGWVMFLDIDEFLTFEKYDNVKDFLSQGWCSKAKAIRFHWKCYSDSGKLKYEEGSVLSRFTELCENKEVNRYYKQIYRTGIANFKMVNVHYPSKLDSIYYADGEAARHIMETKDGSPRHGAACIRHYVTKSLEEFIDIKYKRRGKGSSKTRLNKDFYFRYCKMTAEKSLYFDKYMARLEAGMQSAKTNTGRVAKQDIRISAPLQSPQNKTGQMANSNISRLGNMDYKTPQERAVCPAARKAQNPAIKKGTPEQFNSIRFIEEQKPSSVVTAAAQPNPSERQSDSQYPFGVSVCISAWKTAEYIEECLDSVAAQTWFKNNDNWEILLGIDGCDETLAKVKEIMGKYKNLRVMMMDKNVGTYVTCNTIMKEARYEWLLRFDSDDVMLPNMVETIMKEKGDAEFINCNSCSDKDNIGKISNCSDGQITIKHDTFMEFGGFQNWRCAADTELKTRLSSQIKQKIIQTPLFVYRKNNLNSLTKEKTTKFGSSYRNEKREYIQTKSKNIPKINLTTTSFSTIGETSTSGKTYDNEQTVISLTSWKQRIQTAHKAINSLLQYCKKSHIVLVLSEEEFPQKEKSLPSQIIDLANSEKIEILWTYDNTKAFKKVMPTMEKYKNVPIVSADDDLIYTRDYASELYESFKKSKDVFSVSYRHSKMVTNCGAATLYNPKYYSLILSSFNKKFVDYYEDDMFMQYIVEKNNIKQLFIGDFFPCKSFIRNDEYALNKTYKNVKTPSERKQYCFSEYDKTIKAKTVVNITTWTKRDWCLYPMLKNLKQQTLHPDKIVLWLSEEEYDKDKLPQSIQKCIDENLLTDVMWVKKNTKGHKRYDCFKHFNDCYNILLDDDILYRPTFIEELVNEAKKHQNCITVYSSYSVEYDGVKITRGQYIKEPSHKNNFIAGRCCFPPHIFPFEAYENEDMRNEYVLNCDESWYRPFFIKHGIKINVMHQWDNSHYPIIGGSQDECLWNLNGKVMQNGMRDKERNFYNAIKLTHTETICKKVWKNMGIENYELQK